MVGKDHTNYDANYYDNLLIKWNQSTANGGLNNTNFFTIDMGGVKYTANGASARQSIINKGKIVINDGGQI